MNRGGGFGFDTPAAVNFGGDASYLQMVGGDETPLVGDAGDEEGGFGFAEEETFDVRCTCSLMQCCAVLCRPMHSNAVQRLSVATRSHDYSLAWPLCIFFFFLVSHTRAWVCHCMLLVHAYVR